MYRSVVVWLVAGVVAAEIVPPWWESAVYYRVIVDSFKDTDADGLGDLKDSAAFSLLSGLTKQLSYIRAIGADAAILSSLGARSTDCSKPGALDLVEIDPRYGSSEDFNGLIDKAKKIGLKIVASIPTQTVSSQSEWFKLSADRVPGHEDTIVWREGTVSDIPSPEDGVETWTWYESRNSFWAGSNKEALINLCSESALATLSNVQCAWLKRGVSGLLVNPDFLIDQKCGEKLMKKLSADAMACARSAGLDTPVILVESDLRPEQAARYYGDAGVGASSILSHALTSPIRSTIGMILGIHASILSTKQDFMPTWMSSNSDGSRISTRYGNEMVDAVNLLTLVLPGSAVIQQGDELGSSDTLLEWATSTTCWPSMPSASKLPFPWDDTTNAGFSVGEPWLPLAPNYRYTNAKSEYANDFSHLGIVRVTAALRKSPAFGTNVDIKRLNGAVAVLRWGTAGSLLLVSNLDKETTDAQLSRIPGIPTEMSVATSSGGSSYTISTHLMMDKPLRLTPGETVLLVGGPRHCGGPGPVDKIANKLSEGWQKINKYFSS